MSDFFAKESNSESSHLRELLKKSTTQLDIAIAALQFYAEAPACPELLEVAPEFRKTATEALAKIQELD